VRPREIIVMEIWANPAAIRRPNEGNGAKFWFVPPCPINPIEQVLAKIEHWMRNAQRRTIEETWRAVGQLTQK
jgi:transposase